MSCTPLLRQNQLRKFKRLTAYICRPNHFYSAFSSTCAASYTSPASAQNLSAAKHFRFPHLITRNGAGQLSGLRCPFPAYAGFLSLVLSVPLHLCASALIPSIFISCLSWSPCLAQQKVSGPPLADTALLTTEGDIADAMIAGIDKFLLREIELSVQRREHFWNGNLYSPPAKQHSIKPK